MTSAARGAGRFLAKPSFQTLLDAIAAEGYELVGPTIAEGAIVYDRIRRVQDLPAGWTDVQEAGQYRLKRRDDEMLFSYAVGPHSWKRFLYPASLTVYRAEQRDGTWHYTQTETPTPRYAFIGVRACELAAIAVQDRTLRDGLYADPHYVARREAALFVAVQCAEPAATCFCTSMNTGPACRGGYDLALTELPDGFVIEIGSDRGQQLIDSIDTEPLDDQRLDQARSISDDAAKKIKRRLDTEQLRERLLDNLEDSYWSDVAQRCLSCANCTLVCPTCFCVSLADVPDLRGQTVERHRTWDSCFNPDFSYMNGGLVRDDTRSRYRQWLTHKLATWHDQFGVSGCVGCGRCIAWCPVGIDLTQAAAAIGHQPASKDTQPSGD